MAHIQTPKEFLEDFVQTAAKAKKRIYLQSMLFERGKMIQELEAVLLKKAKEGLDIRVTTDWVSQRYVEDNPHFIPAIKKSDRQYARKVRQQTQDVIARWTQAGIKFTFTNTPSKLSSLISIAGRNHIKMYLIDDTTAWIGGVNLFDHALHLIDVMVRFDDRTLVDALSQQYLKVNEKKPTENYSVDFSHNNTLLIDAGIVGKSLIYNDVLKTVDQAKESIVFASQFLPDGKLLKKLFKAARKGVVVTIITSNKDNKVFHRFPYNIPYSYLKNKIAGTDNISLVHRETRVHAKLLIVDDTVAVFGSHNMTRIGVFLGTEEIAVCTKDKKLVYELKQFIEQPYSA